MFLCQLSGAVPQEPVTTPSGCLFEKRLIEEHLESNPRCPVTQKELKKEDLIPLQTKPINKPSSVALAGSVSALTNALQRNIDSLLLESQQLRNERDQARNQVTHLLYLRDGATRLIAKHIQENDLLKQRIEVLEAERKNDERPRKLSKQAVDEIDFDKRMEVVGPLAEALLAERKQRKIVARPSSAFETFGEDRRPKRSGVTCMSVILSGVLNEEAPNTKKVPYLYAFGSTNGDVTIERWDSEDSISLLKGHESSVTCLQALTYPSATHLSTRALTSLNACSSSSAPFKSCFTLLSGSQDGTVRLWKENKTEKMEEIDYMVELPSGSGLRFARQTAHEPKQMDWSCDNVYRINEGKVTSMAIHPAGLFCAASHDQGWSMLDIPMTTILRKYTLPKVTCNDIAFQPDGNILVGATSDQCLPLWDIRTAELKAQPKVANISGKITSIDFSEIGYIIAIGTSCGKGQIWDLRKINVVQEFEFNSPVNSCKFDHSGRHLAFATNDGVHLYSTVAKKKMDLATHYPATSPIVQTFFDQRTDDYLASLSEDGELVCKYAV